MTVVATIAATIALAAPQPAIAVDNRPPPASVHAAPAPPRDEDSLPVWLLPAGVAAVIVIAALAFRRT
jgi:hypothetical protein